MDIINIKTKSKNYNYCFGNSIFSDGFSELVRESITPSSVLAIIDENVERLHGPQIRGVLSELNVSTQISILRAGERSKSFAEVIRLLTQISEKGFGRDSLIIAVGGGVTGDIAGFISSVYMRGIRIVHVPTTVIAAVDSSIGGKTGINFSGKKNLIGSFHQPELVYFDFDFLKSLPEEEIESGLGELIKYGFIGEKETFYKLSESIESLKRLDFEKCRDVILDAVNIKAAIVAQDEKEAGLRKILNLGHTFAHAFESVLDFNISHGMAVNAGIICSVFLAKKKNLLDDDTVKEMLKLPKLVKLPVILDSLSIEAANDAMRSDKKNKQGKLKFVLPIDFGKIALDIEARKEDVVFAIDKMLELV